VKPYTLASEVYLLGFMSTRVLLRAVWLRRPWASRPTQPFGSAAPVTLVTSRRPPQGLSPFPCWSQLKRQRAVLTSPPLVQSRYSFVVLLAVCEHALMFQGMRLTLVMRDYPGLAGFADAQGCVCTPGTASPLLGCRGS